MPAFTIETSYLLPVFRHATYHAPTIAEAARAALKDEDWWTAKHDYDNARPVWVTGAWEGEDSAYRGSVVPVPPEFTGDAVETHPASARTSGTEDRAITAQEALDAIQTLLDGVEWTPDTLDEIARVGDKIPILTENAWIAPMRPYREGELSDHFMQPDLGIAPIA